MVIIICDKHVQIFYYLNKSSNHKKHDIKFSAYLIVINLAKIEKSEMIIAFTLLEGFLRVARQSGLRRNWAIRNTPYWLAFSLHRFLPICSIDPLPSNNNSSFCPLLASNSWSWRLFEMTAILPVTCLKNWQGCKAIGCTNRLAKGSS